MEVDVRDYKNKLVLSHDPFKDGENFIKYLKYFKHKFLIVNIKSEIETKVFKILKQKKITNYFFLDITIPFIIKLYKNLIKILQFVFLTLKTYKQQIILKVKLSGHG